MSGNFTPYQSKIVDRFYEHRDTALATKLSELVSDLALAEPGKVAELWKSAHTLLKKTSLDQMKAGRVIAERNVAGLAQIAADLQSGKLGAAPKGRPGSGGPGVATGLTREPAAAAPSAPTPSTPPAPAASAGGAPDTLSEANLRSAIKAFKKRLKVTRLDDESKIGNRAMTGGQHSGIVAISPPSQFPRAVWDELVKQGKLKSAGSGLYEFVKD